MTGRAKGVQSTKISTDRPHTRVQAASASSTSSSARNVSSSACTCNVAMQTVVRGQLASSLHHPSRSADGLDDSNLTVDEDIEIAHFAMGWQARAKLRDRMYNYNMYIKDSVVAETFCVAAINIQRIFRGFLARRRFRAEAKMEVAIQQHFCLVANKMALRIQCCWHAYLARQRAYSLRRKLRRTLEPTAQNIQNILPENRGFPDRIGDLSIGNFDDIFCDNGSLSPFFQAHAELHCSFPRSPIESSGYCRVIEDVYATAALCMNIEEAARKKLELCVSQASTEICGLSDEWSENVEFGTHSTTKFEDLQQCDLMFFVVTRLQRFWRRCVLQKHKRLLNDVLVEAWAKLRGSAGNLIDSSYSGAVRFRKKKIGHNTMANDDSNSLIMTSEGVFISNDTSLDFCDNAIARGNKRRMRRFCLENVPRLCLDGSGTSRGLSVIAGKALPNNQDRPMWQTGTNAGLMNVSNLTTPSLIEEEHSQLNEIIRKMAQRSMPGRGTGNGLDVVGDKVMKTEDFPILLTRHFATHCSPLILLLLRISFGDEVFYYDWVPSLSKARRTLSDAPVPPSRAPTERDTHAAQGTRDTMRDCGAVETGVLGSPLRKDVEADSSGFFAFPCPPLTFSRHKENIVYLTLDDIMSVSDQRAAQDVILRRVGDNHSLDKFFTAGDTRIGTQTERKAEKIPPGRTIRGYSNALSDLNSICSSFKMSCRLCVCAPPNSKLMNDSLKLLTKYAQRITQLILFDNDLNSEDDADRQGQSSEKRKKSDGGVYASKYSEAHSMQRENVQENAYGQSHVAPSAGNVNNATAVLHSFPVIPAGAGGNAAKGNGHGAGGLNGPITRAAYKTCSTNLFDMATPQFAKGESQGISEREGEKTHSTNMQLKLRNLANEQLVALSANATEGAFFFWIRRRIALQLYADAIIEDKYRDGDYSRGASAFVASSVVVSRKPIIELQARPIVHNREKDTPSMVYVPSINTVMSNASLLVLRIQQEATVIAWRVIFSHTNYDTYKQDVVSTTIASKKERAIRVQQRNACILACYRSETEHEWFLIISSNLKKIAELYRPPSEAYLKAAEGSGEKGQTLNDEEIEEKRMEVFRFVYRFICECFPSIDGQLVLLPSLLISQAMQKMIRERMVSETCYVDTGPGGTLAREAAEDEASESALGVNPRSTPQERAREARLSARLSARCSTSRSAGKGNADQMSALSTGRRHQDSRDAELYLEQVVASMMGDKSLIHLRNYGKPARRPRSLKPEKSSTGATGRSEELKAATGTGAGSQQLATSIRSTNTQRRSLSVSLSNSLNTGTGQLSNIKTAFTRQNAHRGVMGLDHFQNHTVNTLSTFLLPQQVDFGDRRGTGRFRSGDSMPEVTGTQIHFGTLGVGEGNDTALLEICRPDSVIGEEERFENLSERRSNSPGSRRLACGHACYFHPNGSHSRRGKRTWRPRGVLRDWEFQSIADAEGWVLNRGGASRCQPQSSSGGKGAFNGLKGELSFGSSAERGGLTSSGNERWPQSVGAVSPASNSMSILHSTSRHQSSIALSMSQSYMCFSCKVKRFYLNLFYYYHEYERTTSQNLILNGIHCRDPQISVGEEVFRGIIVAMNSIDNSTGNASSVVNANNANNFSVSSIFNIQKIINNNKDSNEVMRGVVKPRETEMQRQGCRSPLSGGRPKGLGRTSDASMSQDAHHSQVEVSKSSNRTLGASQNTPSTAEGAAIEQTTPNSIISSAARTAEEKVLKSPGPLSVDKSVTSEGPLKYDSMLLTQKGETAVYTASTSVPTGSNMENQGKYCQEPPGGTQCSVDSGTGTGVLSTQPISTAVGRKLTGAQLTQSAGLTSDNDRGQISSGREPPTNAADQKCLGYNKTFNTPPHNGVIAVHVGQHTHKPLVQTRDVATSCGIGVTKSSSSCPVMLPGCVKASSNARSVQRRGTEVTGLQGRAETSVYDEDGFEARGMTSEDEEAINSSVNSETSSSAYEESGDSDTSSFDSSSESNSHYSYTCASDPRGSMSSLQVQNVAGCTTHKGTVDYALDVDFPFSIEAVTQIMLGSYVGPLKFVNIGLLVATVTVKLLSVRVRVTVPRNVTDAAMLSEADLDPVMRVGSDSSRSYFKSLNAAIGSCDDISSRLLRSGYSTLSNVEGTFLGSRGENSATERWRNFENSWDVTGNDADAVGHGVGRNGGDRMNMASGIVSKAYPGHIITALTQMITAILMIPNLLLFPMARQRKVIKIIYIPEEKV